jgi:hypothetical protein
MERKHTHIRVGTAADWFSASISGTNGMRRILDDNTPFCESADFGRCMGETTEVNRHDRLDLRCRFQRHIETTQGHAQRIAVDVNEPCVRASIEKTIRRCRKRHRRGEPSITRPDVRGETSNVQRRRTAADRNGVTGANPLCQRSLELLNDWALREKIAAKHRNDGIDIRLIDALSSVPENKRRHSTYSMAAFS